MGTIRTGKDGKQKHWTDAWLRFAVKRVRRIRQKKSLKNQKSLFDGEPEKKE